MPRRPDLKQRERLIEELRNACRDGEIGENQLLPSTRQLATRYHVSPDTVALVIQQLTSEGLLYTVPRVGTFVNAAQASRQGVFVMLLPHEVHLSVALSLPTTRSHFEQTVARLGGTVWTPTVEVFLQHIEQNALPNLAGVLIFGNYPYAEQVEKALMQIKQNSPDVGFVSFEATPLAVRLGADVLNFDNFDGAVQATELLMREGHQNIAFLGIHRPSAPEEFAWSVQREAGWKAAMLGAGQFSERLCFLPKHQSDEGVTHLTQKERGRIVARPLVEAIQTGEVGAVVSVSHDVTTSLIECLAEAQLPVASWPAIIAFDDEKYSDSHIIAALSLPWDEIGTKAATFLWERVIKRQQETPRYESLKMRLIRRYSAISSLYSLTMSEKMALDTPQPLVATNVAG